MDKKVKWQRREILGGLLSVGVGLPLLSISPLFFNGETHHRFLRTRELLLLDGLLKVWSEGWPTLSKEPLEKDLTAGLDEVLKVVRRDKRSDLLMALRLLTYGPSCYFLTGYFDPWSNPEKIKDVLKRWSQTTHPTESAIFCALSALVSASYYTRKETWSGIGYPGPPEIARGGN